jgi:hypothetical protein
MKRIADDEDRSRSRKQGVRKQRIKNYALIPYEDSRFFIEDCWRIKQKYEESRESV